MQVTIATKAGACYGVNRALDIAYAAADSSVPVHTLGPLIHNPRVVAELADNGIMEADTLDQAGTGTIVIRSHGTTPQVIAQARERGFKVDDATCPFVSKVHQHARNLAAEGYSIIIIGEEGHAEVEGINAWGGDAVIAIVDEPSQVPDTLPDKVGVVVQTTQSEARYEAILSVIKQRCSDVRAHKTICQATSQRQDAAAQLAGQSDVMVVIGGRNSGNTRRLVEICSAICPTYHIEGADELEPSWFAGAEHVGITAGASTPQAHIDAVVEAVNGMGA